LNSNKPLITFNNNFIFWDFDGVIKDSVEIKGKIFESIFQEFGFKISNKIKLHHEQNGGMSRYHKIPVYLEFSSLPSTKENIEYYLSKFSELTKKEVINSNWVKGAYEYLDQNYKEKSFFLITATPKKEIEEITKELKIFHFFKEIFGSPVEKSNAIEKIILDYNIASKDAILIGDSKNDFDAAMNTNLSFVLRKTKLNIDLQSNISCKQITNFYDE